MEILKETTDNIKSFEDICSKQNNGITISKEERDFIEYFDFKLAESLLKELGDIAMRAAEHILISRKDNYEK